jgi:hypothetical protein
MPLPTPNSDKDKGNVATVCVFYWGDDVRRPDAMGGTENERATGVDRRNRSARRMRRIVTLNEVEALRRRKRSVWIAYTYVTVLGLIWLALALWISRPDTPARQWQGPKLIAKGRW